jgi:hypothetical protein
MFVLPSFAGLSAVPSGSSPSSRSICRLLSVFRSPLVSHPNKLEVKAQYRSDPAFWLRRPLAPGALDYVVADGAWGGAR